jgi:hypothetical protein
VINKKHFASARKKMGPRPPRATPQVTIIGLERMKFESAVMHLARQKVASGRWQDAAYRSAKGVIVKRWY